MNAQIKTIAELINYIADYSDVIYVREKRKGKWGSYSLKELPGDIALKHAARFINEGILPTRLKREDELINKDSQND